MGHWENESNKKKENLFSPLKLIYQQGEQFQTIFVADKKKEIYDRLGTVISGRNDEVYFHFFLQDFSDGDKGFARWHSEDGLKFYGIEDGLIDHQVTDLLLDRADNLWVATLCGLSRFDGNAFHNFTTADGLPSDRIRCLHEDRQGHLWIGTDGGVVHYNGQHFQTIKSPHIGPVSQILEDRDGTFWFGTTQGSIIRYRQRRISPQIRLIRVITDQVYEDLKEVILSKINQQVIFEYRGVSFSTCPGDLLYIYRLKGYDTDWQPATREMRAYYRDLAAGRLHLSGQSYRSRPQLFRDGTSANFGRARSAYRNSDSHTQH